jgi:hypothetical protein
MNLVGCNNQDKNLDQSNKFDIYGKTWIQISASSIDDGDNPIPNEIIISKDSIIYNRYWEGELVENYSFTRKIVDIKADTIFWTLKKFGKSEGNLIYNPLTPDSIIVKYNLTQPKEKLESWSEVWVANPFEERFFSGLLPTNDEALLELTKWKEKKDLELITQKEYNSKLKELKPYIK